MACFSRPAMTFRRWFRGNRLLTAVAGLAIAFLTTPAAMASTIGFATGPQSLTASGKTYSENAIAWFTVTSHSITVQLINLIVNPSDLDQAIGSLRFTVSGVTGTTTSATTTASFTDISLNSSGSLTGVTDRTSTLWQTTPTLQGTTLQMTMCAVCATGGASAKELILGSPNGTNGATGSYAAADFKSTGQWVIGSGLTYTSGALKGHITTPSWTINLPNANLSTVVISNVVFGFGDASSNYGWDTFTVPQETPEPDSLILFGTGLALVALAAGTKRMHRP